MSDKLTVCFSASGVTAETAAALAAAEGTDLAEIRPEAPYTEADLDWRNKQSRSTLEMADKNCRPAIEDPRLDMDGYTTVFLGFPIWWGREPSVVDTFLDRYSFAGKKIVVFCTSGGSGMGATAARIRELTKNEAEVIDGGRIGGSVSPEDLKTWAEGLIL